MRILASVSRFVWLSNGFRCRGPMSRVLGGTLLVLAGLVSCGGGGKGSGEVPFSITLFSANPPQVPYGGSTRLDWAYSGVPSSLKLNGAGVSGQSATVTPVRRQTYTLEGQNGAGSASRQVKVAAKGLDLLAGNPAGRGSLDGVSPQAGFNTPTGVTVDSLGNVFVADCENHTVRKVTPTGVVSTLAGAPGEPGSTNGTGSAARFDWPFGVAVDGTGQILVSDRRNNSIRKISPEGVVTTLAGTPGVVGSLDGIGAAASFSNPEGLALDAAGNAYVADCLNNRIRKISPVGVVTTLLNNTGAVATFSLPTSIAVDAAGNLYVGEFRGSTVYKMTPGGVITALADGSLTGDYFNYPAGLAVDSAGTVFVADMLNSQIRKISPAGNVTVLAGRFYGAMDGPGATAQFGYPGNVALDTNGNVYVADTSNHTIRKITADAVVSTLAGTAMVPRASDGLGANAGFSWPMGVASDASGNVFVADSESHTIRKVTTAGMVSTLAGNASSLPGSTDGTGSAALFKSPEAVAVDASGNVYVSDTWNHTIRRVTPAGLVSTLAGSPGLYGTTDGVGPTARFMLPSGVAVDASGNVYVADTSNQTIRKITPGGLVTTLAGMARSGGVEDGLGTSARFSQPRGLAVDPAGNVYVADSYNHTIRKVTPAGLVSTLAGTAKNPGTADGLGSVARFNYPQGLVVDATGNVYVADTESHTIRKITPMGLVSTVAGTAGRPAFVAGPTSTYLVAPQSVALTPDGDLVVPCNNALVQVTAPE